MTLLFSQDISIVPKAGRIKYFLKNLARLTNHPSVLDNARVQYCFHCAARAIKNLRNDNNFTRRDRYDRLGDQRNAEQACNFSSEESGGSVSELFVFVREKKMAGIIL